MHRSAALMVMMAGVTALAAEPATRPPQSAFEPGSPRAVAESLTTALGAGDGAAIRQALYPANDAERHLVDAMVAMSEAIAKLRPVAAKRYGEVPARVVTGDLTASAADQHAKLEAAFQQIEGDVARITFADQSIDSIVLRRIDARWRIPVAERTGALSAAEIEMRASDLLAVAKAIDEVTEACAGGKWQTPNDVVIAIQEHVLKEQQARHPATLPVTTTAPVVR